MRIFPKPLQPGACIGLIGPASPIPAGGIIKCADLLRRLGHYVIVGEALKQECNLYGYLAGSAKSRAEDINRMFADSRVDAIFCTRGGYGSAELVKYLDYECIRQNPKIFVGYSDITALHAALGKRCGFVTFHGPMVWTNLLPGGNMSVADTVYSMRNLYTACNMKRRMVFRNPPGEELQIICTGEHSQNIGQHEGCNQQNMEEQRRSVAQIQQGRLFGGNLSVLAHLLGTPFSPIGEGEILFLEEVGESIARIHMYLIQMKSAGLFDGVKGILLGDFTDCRNDKYDETLGVQTFLQEWFERLGIPVLGNVCSDHRRGAMMTLPLGAWCRMDIVKREIVFEN